MAHIIRFPTSSDIYPARGPDLEEPEAVLLLGPRWWVADVRDHQNPLPRLRQSMALAGGTARRPLEVHGPGRDCLSADETQFLRAASLVRAGDSPRAEQVLRTALLSAQGADMALGPLQGIARLFSAARLLPRRRCTPAGAAASVLHWPAHAAHPRLRRRRPGRPDGGPAAGRPVAAQPGRAKSCDGW